MSPERESDALMMLTDAAIDREEDFQYYLTAPVLLNSEEEKDSDAPILTSSMNKAVHRQS